MARVKPVMPDFDTAYAALGHPCSSCLPDATAFVNSSISAVTSATVLVAENRSRMEGEYLEFRCPDMLETLTRRPPGRRRGRRSWVVARVP